MRDAVRGACELLGLDPLHIANEGQFLAVVAPEFADLALNAVPARPTAATRRASSARSAKQPARRCRWSTHAMAAPASSTCSSAIPCRAFVRERHMMATAANLATQIEERAARAQSSLRGLLLRSEARKLAEACREMSERFYRAAGCWPSVAAPAPPTPSTSRSNSSIPSSSANAPCPHWISPLFMQPWLDAILRPEDIVMGFGPPEGDPEVWPRSNLAHRRGAMTSHCPAPSGSYALQTSVRRSLHTPGIGRDLLSHALGNSACLPRASRTRPGCRPKRDSFIRFSARKTGDVVHRRRSRRLDPHEGPRRHRSCARASPRKRRSKSAQPRWPSTSASRKAANSSSSAMAARRQTPTTGPSTACCRPKGHRTDSRDLARHGARQHHRRSPTTLAPK